MSLKEYLTEIKNKIKFYKVSKNIINNKMTDNEMGELLSSLNINEQIVLLSMIERKSKEAYLKACDNRTLVLIKSNNKKVL